MKDNRNSSSTGFGRQRVRMSSSSSRESLRVLRLGKSWDGDVGGDPVGAVEPVGGADVEEDDGIARVEIVLDGPFDGECALVAEIDNETVVIGITVDGGVGKTEVLAVTGHREGHIRHYDERHALTRDGGTVGTRSDKLKDTTWFPFTVGSEELEPESSQSVKEWL
ncbi:hypothetical protein ACFX1X_009341 [Malus domestica]